MIITCPSCTKKFNIDINLIPLKGRDLQCGSCQHIWFYKKNNSTLQPTPVNEDIRIEINENINEINEQKTEDPKKIKINKDEKNEKSELSDFKQTKNKTKIKKKNQSSKFFSYSIVFIFSLVALVILLDTLKTPLIEVFPGLEQILFNLYETLKDIKLFIIDLS